MVNTTTLRAYLDDIQGLLKAGSTAKVISHCRHILRHYPQNVETYRLLAQAMFDRAERDGVTAHYDEALDLYQRVLSVLPNDSIAHRDVSHIRERNGELDQAIWHMERAHEQTPGDQVLQDALRALYTRRDGETVQSKLPLSRGTLIRQYINAQLYDQALIELRAALNDAPSRVDLQVLLAETLWETHHQVEAGEVAVTILKKLPFCLSANRIMARLWLDNERPADAQVFLDRVQAVDPYAARRVLAPDADGPDTNVITRLDYEMESQLALSSEAPDWIAGLDEAEASAAFWPEGGKGAFDSSDQPAAAPFVGGGAKGFDEEVEIPASAQSPESIATEESFSDWLGEIGDAAGDELDEEPEASEEMLLAADWFQDVVETEPPDSGDASREEPSPSPVAAFDDWSPDEMLELPGDDATAVPGEVPDWLSEALGTSSEDDALSGEAAEAPAQPIESERDADLPGEEAVADIPDWFDEAPEPALPDWFAEIPDEAEPDSGHTDEEDDFAASGEQDRESLETAADDVVDPMALAFDEWQQEAAASDAQRPDEQELSSGFTDLLAEVSRGAVTSPGESDDDVDDEMSSPAWLAQLSEAEEHADDSRVIDQGDEFALPDIADDVDDNEQVHTEEHDPAQVGTSMTDESSQLPWDQPESDDQPETPESSGGDADDALDWMMDPENDFFALAEKQDDETTGDVFSPGPELEPDDTEAGDWLRVLDEAGDTPLEDVPPESELAHDADRGLEARLDVWDDDDLGEDDLPAEAATDIPDWLTEAAPTDEAVEDVSGLAALFDEPSPGGDAEIAAAPQSEVDEMRPDEEPGVESGDQELDWLGRLSGAEQFESDDGVSSAPVEKEAFYAESVAEDVSDTGTETDRLPGRAESDVDWLEDESQVPDLDALRRDADSEDFEPEATGAADSDALPESDASELDDLATSDEVAVDRGEHVAPEDQASPAWLAGLEVEASEQDAESLDEALAEPYDPFEEGSPDLVPAYETATETGVLQPDESPPWMTAFTGEELPPEEEEEEVMHMFDSAQEQEPEELEIAASGADVPADDSASELAETQLEHEITPEEERPDREPAPDAAEDTGEDVMPPNEELEGGMPSWLRQITESEADKLGDDLLDEAEEGSVTPDDLADVFDGASVEREAGEVTALTGEAESPPESDAIDLGALFDDAEVDAADQSESAAGVETSEDAGEDDALAALLDAAETGAEAEASAVDTFEGADGERPGAEFDFDEFLAETEEAPQDTPSALSQDESLDIDQVQAQEAGSESLVEETEGAVLDTDEISVSAIDIEAETEEPTEFMFEESEPLELEFDTAEETDIEFEAPEEAEFVLTEDDDASAPVFQADQEVAEPDDMAHTKVADSEAVGEDETDLETDALETDDFAFDDVVPAWLRRPKEDESFERGESREETAHSPEWLRDVFEDDEVDDADDHDTGSDSEFDFD